MYDFAHNNNLLLKLYQMIQGVMEQPHGDMFDFRISIGHVGARL